MDAESAFKSSLLAFQQSGASPQRGASSLPFLGNLSNVFSPSSSFAGGSYLPLSSSPLAGGGQSSSMSSSSAANGGFFSGITETTSGWMSSLRSSIPGLGDQASSDADNCGLTRFQRVIAFFACLFGCGVCFVMSIFMLPVAIVMPQKFALLYTVGSLLFFTSLALFRGPKSFLWNLIGRDRLFYTLTYFGSMFATLYSILSIQSYFLAIFFCILQMVTLGWFLMTYMPWGTSGLKLLWRGAQTTLPL